MRLAILFVLVSLICRPQVASSAYRDSTCTIPPEITEISLRRESCNGMCPADELVLFADGDALYAGYAGALRSGLHTGKIDVASFKMYAAYLTEQGFFEKDVVITSPRGPGEAPVRYITAVRGGIKTSKRLVSEVAPTWWAMERLFQVITDKVNWQPVNSGVRGRFLTSSEDKTSFWAHLPLPDAFITVSRVSNTTLTPPLDSISQSSFLCKTDKEGKFELPLPPGEYVIASRYYPPLGQGVVGKETTITIQSHRFSSIILSIK